VNKARECYINYEKKNLEDQVADLTQTLAINKQMINELFTGSDKLKCLEMLNQENKMLGQRLKEC